jgi:hypothetical protein
MPARVFLGLAGVAAGSIAIEGAAFLSVTGGVEVRKHQVKSH